LSGSTGDDISEAMAHIEERYLFYRDSMGYSKSKAYEELLEDYRERLYSGFTYPNKRKGEKELMKRVSDVMSHG